jgi:uncharacterized protein (DUF2147 family)
MVLFQSLQPKPCPQSGSRINLFFLRFAKKKQIFRDDAVESVIRYSQIIFLAFLIFLPTHAHAASDPIAGLWYTDDHEGGVELYPCGEEICGRFYWLQDNIVNGDLSRDIRNSDPAKRQRPLCRTQFMWGFKPDHGGHYTDGTIYSPLHGANFSAKMSLVDPDTLDLHGYLLFSFLGESRTWTRAKTMPHCVTSLGKS